MCSQDAIQAILSMKGSERKQWSITRQHGATRSNLHLIWNEEETLSTIGDHPNLVEQRAKTFPSEGTDITTSQLRKSSDESPLNFHFNFVDFCPTVGNLLFTAECRRHKTRTRQVDLQNLCKSLSLQNLREISQPFFAVFLTFPCLLEVKSNAKKS